jgi:hypothetical protein
LKNRLDKNQSRKYIVGTKVTIADVDIAGMVFSYFCNENNYLS